MMTKHSPKFVVSMVTALFVGLSATFFSGCWLQEDSEERIYTVYVKVRAHKSPIPEATPEPTPDLVVEVPAVEPHSEPVMAEPTVTPMPTPTKAPRIAKPKPTPVDDRKLELQAKRFFSTVIGELETRGLLADDIKDGKQRLAMVQQLLVKREFAVAMTLLQSFNNDVITTAVDDAFITQKNTRLLNLIQEVKPSAEVQALIDKESEIINQLLEHSDYSAINRRMNDLFHLVEKSRP